MKKTVVNFVFSVIATVFFLLPSTLMAQDTPPLSEMWVMVPKSGQAEEMAEGLKKHMAFRTEQGDPREWQTYTPLLGDNLNRYAVRYCCINWADVDSYRAWSSENKQVGEHFAEHVGAHVEKFEHYFETNDWGNSHWSEENGPYTLFAVTDFHIKPGHGDDFEAAKEKMSQIAINHGWASDDHVWIWSKTIGGKQQESIVIPHANFASMSRDEDSFFRFLSKHMGEAGASELLEQFSASAYSEFQIWEHSKKLSMEISD